MSNVIDFYEGAARVLGFASMAALDAEVCAIQDAERQSDPKWKAYVRECRMYRRLERARRRP